MKLTVPVGVAVSPEWLSLTVAVQVVVAPAAGAAGAQLTAVVVGSSRPPGGV